MATHVYRRPFDYRAKASPQRLAFNANYAQASAVTLALPPQVRPRGGVFRRSFDVAPSRAFFVPSTQQESGGSTSIAFSCSATLEGLVDPTTTVVYFSNVVRARARWERKRYDEAPIRLLQANAQYTSWQPTGEAYLAFSNTATAVAQAHVSGSASLSFANSSTGQLTARCIGQTSITFASVAVTANETPIFGSTSLSFTNSAAPQMQTGGSTTLSFTVMATNAVSELTGSSTLRFTNSAILVPFSDQTAVEVPYLIGFTQAPAEALISSMYCIPSVIGTGGTVVSQSPVAFSTVPRGTTITITMGGPVNSVSRRRRGGQVPYNLK